MYMMLMVVDANAQRTVRARRILTATLKNLSVSARENIELSFNLAFPSATGLAYCGPL
jgi:hypothetical protein